MRIVIDCRCVFDGCGGIGTYARQLASALALINDADEFVLLRTGGRPLSPVTDAPNFRDYTVEAAMLDADWEQLQLPSVLEELEADLYHNPTFALPIVAPCHTVTTIHDVVFERRPDLVSPSLCQYLARWSRVAARVADRIITVSHYSRCAIEHVYDVDPTRIDVTYEAVDLARFTPEYKGPIADEFRARYGIAGPFILYVGALEPKKNIDNLLAAFARAARSHGIPHQLVLAGGVGGMRYDADEAAQAFGVPERTIVTGFLPDRYLPAAYRAADVFVYPSLYEGFGLPPLEAMACCTPTLVSSATSLPEVVGEGALLVDPLDVPAMADALVRLAEDGALRTGLAERGLKRAKEFSWQATALDTLASYRHAVA